MCTDPCISLRSTRLSEPQNACTFEHHAQIDRQVAQTDHIPTCVRTSGPRGVARSSDERQHRREGIVSDDCACRRRGGCQERCMSLCCTVPNERGCVVHLSLIRVVRVGCLMRSRCACLCLLLVLFCAYHSRRDCLLYVYIWACLDAQDLELDMLSDTARSVGCNALKSTGSHVSHHDLRTLLTS
ncbi:hypothetical protein BC629DRAFT_1042266 [Irpex lacteus]|nr:hypothetical protein BC629DRAFT_1042266 [Irpex lacteus]